MLCSIDGYFLIFIIFILTRINCSEEHESRTGTKNTKLISSKNTKDRVSLQNSVAQAYIIVDTRTGGLSEVNLVGTATNRDQKSEFIIEYNEKLDLGKPVQATILHFTSRKYLSPTENSVKIMDSPYTWNITQVIGGDILIGLSNMNSDKYLSCDESNNIILEQVNKNTVEDTGKPGRPLKRYQWSRIISARISRKVSNRIAAILGMPVSSE